MDEEIKILSQMVVKKIDRKIRSTIKKEPYKLSKTIDIGADGTPTKYIDKIAEDVAVKIINNADIPMNLLSEEIGFVDNGGEYLIVLDPVDGTRNAMRGIPFFSVSLAIGKTKLSDIEYGIVKNVATRDEFIAEKQHGAFFNKNPIVIPDMPASEQVYSINFSRPCDPALLSLTSLYKIRSLGAASLEMCMVATGALDGYIESLEYLRITDIAAATLFVREAGGFVADRTGSSLDMGLTLDERTSVLTAGNANLIDSMVKNL